MESLPWCVSRSSGTLLPKRRSIKRRVELTVVTNVSDGCPQVVGTALQFSHGHELTTLMGYGHIPWAEDHGLPCEFTEMRGFGTECDGCRLVAGQLRENTRDFLRWGWGKWGVDPAYFKACLHSGPRLRGSCEQTA